MKPRSVTIELDGTSYEVPRLTIGQLEQVAEATSGLLSPTKATFEVLRIALARATPKVEKFEELTPDGDEVKAAAIAILELSGLRKKDAPSAGGEKKDGALPLGEAAAT